MSLQVPTQQGIQVVLDPLTWGWLQASIWVTVGLGLAFVVAVVYHLVSEFRTPLESKAIRAASHKHRAGAIIASDDGNADYRFANKPIGGGESCMETQSSKSASMAYSAFYPRPGVIPGNIDVDTAGGKDLAKTRDLARYLIDLNTRKLHLRGARTSLWVGVETKAILMSIYAIAGIQATEMIEQITSSIGQVFPIDVYAMKQMVFGGSYNESQVKALAKIHEHIGEERTAKKGTEKMVLLIGLGMMIIGAAMLVIAVFMSK